MVYSKQQLRVIQERLKITGDLEAITSIHVGGHSESFDTDMPLACNGEGKFYASGTSLAGILRAWCQKSFSEKQRLINKIWGFQDEKENDKGQASYIIIEDAVIDLNDGLIEIRDGVGIDRILGTAVENFKFDRAVIPKASKTKFKMLLDIPSADSNDFKTIIGHLLEALTNEKIRLGAAKTRGLGRVKLTNTEIYLENRNSAEGILKVLKKDLTNSITINELKACNQSLKPTIQPQLNIKIEWNAVGPIMVKASYDAMAVDTLPLTGNIGNQVALLLPGTSIKGSLRSQAEKIVRTILEKCANKNDDSNQRFTTQTKLDLIENLFGLAGETKKQANKIQKNEIKPGLAALSVDDCYARNEIPQEKWQDIEFAKTEKDLIEKLEKANLRKPNSQEGFQQAFHVSIDRWTSAASDGALYSVLEPYAVSWNAICLTLDFSRLPNDKHEIAIMLLLLLLRDLMSNRIPLGFATNRGMGEIEIKKISIQGEALPNNLQSLANICFTEKTFSELDKTLGNLLKEKWNSWVKENQPKKEGK